jgi:methylase of polypeptide subunit release factors
MAEPATSARAGTPAMVTFGGLMVPTAPDVLTPRPWTLVQCDWAVGLLGRCGPGPVLELFAGSGHIGSEVGRRTGRPVVLVDASLAACRLASATAAANGVVAEVRCATVCAHEVDRARPALVLADPPYVPASDVSLFADDPVTAIDGGPDGLEPARVALHAAQHTVRAGVPMLLQLRGLQQVAAMDAWLATHHLECAVREVRCPAEDRAVALIERC